MSVESSSTLAISIDTSVCDDLLEISVISSGSPSRRCPPPAHAEEDDPECDLSSPIMSAVARSCSSHEGSGRAMYGLSSFSLSHVLEEAELELELDADEDDELRSQHSIP